MGICASNVDQPPQQTQKQQQPQPQSTGRATGTALSSSTSSQPQQSSAPDRPLPASIPLHSDAHWDQREKMRQAAEARLSVQKKRTTATKRYSTNTGLTPTVTSRRTDADDSSEGGRSVEMADLAAPSDRQKAGVEESKDNTEAAAPRHRRVGSLEKEHPEWFGAAALNTRDSVLT
jgi:hypothetical protein